MTHVTDEIFGAMVAGLDEALAHAEGEPLPGLVIHCPERLDVAAIRRKTDHTQPVFARSIGARLST